MINLYPSNTDTINELKKILEINLNIKKEEISIKPHNEIPSYVYQQYINFINKQINETTLIKNLISVGCDFFIIEIN